MIKLNFQQFSVPTGISRKNRQTGDARESFANMLYLNVNGIRAHALAMKIYNSEGEENYSPEEVKLIKEVAEKLCAPNFIDGLMEQLNNQKNE
ncbi:MAG: hypothetical protein J6Q35_07425 [Rikenellaceae bacterium]|nr:hypothetical protein [Rikenellaceae bacterium]